MEERSTVLATTPCFGVKQSNGTKMNYVRLNPEVRNPDNTTPVHSVWNLGIYVDSDVSMRTHVVETVSSCFAILRRIRSIRRSVSSSVLKSLDRRFTGILPRMDYNATLAGLPRQLLDRLQSVMNAAARLVFSARKYDHITPLLRDLHCMVAHSTTDRVPSRSSRIPLPAWSRPIVSLHAAP